MEKTLVLSSAAYGDMMHEPQDKNSAGDPCAEWIGDLLAGAAKCGCDTKALLRNCGRACAVRKGHVAAMSGLKALAASCRTRADYATFLKGHLPGCTVEEAEDGILVHLNKAHCGCPMFPRVSDPALCDCTAGSNQATWSEFFGRSVPVDVVESHLRGGRDCILKIRI